MPDKNEINRRIEHYWQPYHERLSKTLKILKNEFGGVLLFEAHSIKSEVPRFFDGQLPDFNFGTYDGKSCSSELFKLIENWVPKNYSKVINARFKGGYITRKYGDPKNNVHAIQLELSQATYMNEANLTYETSKANKVKEELKNMFDLFFKFVNQL